MSQILLVDDDADIRRIVKKILDREGFHVVAIDNGLSALDELNNNHYDLLLSDANMPQYSGFDLIRTLKRNGKHDHLLIAMLTGRKDKNDIQAAIDLGVQDYIIKPIEPAVLVKKINKLLRPTTLLMTDTEEAVHIDIEAQFTGQLQITSVSLQEITAISEFPLPENLKLTIDSDHFEFLRGDGLYVKISSCQRDTKDSTIYILRAQIIEEDALVIKKLKTFLNQYHKAS